MWSGPFLRVKFSDLFLVLSHGSPLYTVSRITTADDGKLQYSYYHKSPFLHIHMNIHNTNSEIPWRSSTFSACKRRWFTVSTFHNTLYHGLSKAHRILRTMGRYIWFEVPVSFIYTQTSIVTNFTKWHKTACTDILKKSDFCNGNI